MGLSIIRDMLLIRDIILKFYIKFQRQLYNNIISVRMSFV